MKSIYSGKACWLHTNISLSLIRLPLYIIKAAPGQILHTIS